MEINLEQAKNQLVSALKGFEEQLKKLRTGRASASMLDSVMVQAYGQKMPLNHVASVSVLDAQMLQVSPFDPNSLYEIASAIRDDKALNLNPVDDGHVVRVPIPSMTTERRQEIVKSLHEKAEQTRISLRNIRHELFNSLKKQVADKDISEDNRESSEKLFTVELDKTNAKLEEMIKAKEQEIMTV